MVRDFILLLTVLLYKVKNRILIFASQRPEVFFSFLLIVLVGGSAALFLPMLLDFQVEMTEEQFPRISYTFITASLFPFIVWVLRQNHEETQSFTILDYMYRGYFVYFKSVFQYIAPAFLSFVFLYLILSIYSNLSILYSLLFWHIVGLSIMVISYSFALLINNKGIDWRLIKHSHTFLKTVVVILVLLIMMLPFHKGLGTLWLSKSVPFEFLIVLFIGLMCLYIFLISQKVRFGKGHDGLESSRTRFKDQDSIYSFLLLVDSGKVFLFHFLSILFLFILSLITEQPFVMMELFQIIIIIGNIGLIFHKVEKVARPLYALRASNFTFSIWLLHFYVLISIVSVLIFYILISISSEYSLFFLLENTEPLVSGIVLYFCIFLSIVVSYLFGDYFGPIVQSISSGVILIISYKIVPEIFLRVTMIHNIFLEGVVWLFLVCVMFLIKWLTIQDYSKYDFTA